ncbi:putative uncharacterized protein encoded by ZNF503-AS2 isoform X2 [Callithrix jacchus]
MPVALQSTGFLWLSFALHLSEYIQLAGILQETAPAGVYADTTALRGTPSARAAASLASKGGWTSGAPRLRGLSLLGSAWQPPPLLVLRKPIPPGSPAVKTESKFPFRGIPNFPR